MSSMPPERYDLLVARGSNNYDGEAEVILLNMEISSMSMGTRRYDGLVDQSFGGAIAVQDSRVILDNVTITDITSNFGAGLWMSDSDVTLTSVKINRTGGEAWQWQSETYTPCFYVNDPADLIAMSDASAAHPSGMRGRSNLPRIHTMERPAWDEFLYPNWPNWSDPAECVEGFAQTAWEYSVLTDMCEYGGGIYANGGSLTFGLGVVIEDSVATVGSAIYLVGGVRLTIDEGAAPSLNGRILQTEGDYSQLSDDNIIGAEGNVLLITSN